MTDVAAQPAAVNMIAEFEDFRAKPYQDAGGVWTIGYGSVWLDGTGPLRVGPDTASIDEPTARAWLTAELQQSVRTLSQMVKVPLTDGEQAALEDFIYNLGIGNFVSSALLRKLNAGDYRGAAAQLDLWICAGGHVMAGLLRRRQAETKLFQGAG
jgi:lysozyme